MEESLLFEEKSQSDGKKWRSYESLGRSSSVLPTTSFPGIEVSIDEIQSATGIYPLVSSLEPYHLPPNEQAVGYQGGYRGPYEGYGSEVQRQMFTEIEIRELVMGHVGHRCCWGSRPARTWKIHAVEDCNVYVETLETFLEEREVQKEIISYVDDSVHTKDKGPQVGI